MLYVWDFLLESFKSLDAFHWTPGEKKCSVHKFPAPAGKTHLVHGRRNWDEVGMNDCRFKFYDFYEFSASLDNLEGYTQNFLWNSIRSLRFRYRNVWSNGKRPCFAFVIQNPLV